MLEEWDIHRMNNIKRIKMHIYKVFTLGLIVKMLTEVVSNDN